jgi:transcriptional regulator with XRE-family HTH domain
MPRGFIIQNKTKQLRLSLGFTMKQMAEALKVPFGTYKKWEYNDRRTPLWLPMIGDLLLRSKFIQEKNTEKIVDSFMSDLKNNGYSLDEIIEVFIFFSRRLKKERQRENTTMGQE